MPLFDVKCWGCGEQFEELFTGDPPECPLCGCTKTSKVYNKGVTVSGSGMERIKNRANNPPTEPTRVYIRRK